MAGNITGNHRLSFAGCKYVCLVALLLVLSACENGIIGSGDQPDPNPKPEPTKQGIAQKGPFEIGSNITIVTRPAPDFLPTATDQVQTLDDIGSFEFEFKPDTLYDISVTGRHFSEITGELSADPITLQSTYYHDADSAPFVSVNILTHIIHSRINYLIANQGLHPRDATAQASQELLNDLTSVIFADHLSDYSFSNMSVYNLTDSDPNANAILLFISAAFYQQSIMFDNSRTLAEMLTTLAADLEKDGKINGINDPDSALPPGKPPQNGQVYLSSLDAAARRLNPESISDNLSRHSLEKTGVALPVPDINFLLDNDADGVRNDVDSDDDGDGIADSDDANPYQFDIITAPQSFTTEQDTGVSISLEFNVPEDPASTLFPGYDNHPAHGVLSGEFPHFTYTPMRDSAASTVSNTK